MKTLVPVCLLALAACELPLPPDAYEPANLDLGQVQDAAPRMEGGMTYVPTIPGGSAGGTEGGGTQGGIGGGGGDAGAGDTLSKLIGRYYMRMDMLSDATVTISPLIEVRTRNRVSHLLVTQLYAEGGQLKAQERLCHQTFAHVCEEGCSTLSTRLDARVTDKLVTMMPFERTYTVGSDNKLTAGLLKMPLGFDAAGGAALPSGTGDARVWDVDGNGSGDGMLTELKSTGVFAVQCNVYNVQNFGSQFQGSLGSGARPLVGATFALTTQIEGRVLGATNDNCKDNGNSSSVKRSETVRFAPVPAALAEGEAFWNCPDVSEWDKVLPGASP